MSKSFTLLTEEELEELQKIFQVSHTITDSWDIPREEFPSFIKECTCGAKHTSFKNKHLSWCDLKE